MSQKRTFKKNWSFIGLQNSVCEGVSLTLLLHVLNTYRKTPLFMWLIYLHLTHRLKYIKPEDIAILRQVLENFTRIRTFDQKQSPNKVCESRAKLWNCNHYTFCPDTPTLSPPFWDSQEGITYLSTHFDATLLWNDAQYHEWEVHSILRKRLHTKSIAARIATVWA